MIVCMAKKMNKKSETSLEEERIMNDEPKESSEDPVSESVESEDRLVPPTEETPKVDVPVGDYLRQYQVKKQTVKGSLESDPPVGSKAEKMKKKLLASPRVRMLIPKNSGESETIPQSVTLNGYRLDLPKNTYIEVPEPVADVLMESLKQTNKALNQFLIAGNKERETALQ